MVVAALDGKGRLKGSSHTTDGDEPVVMQGLGVRVQGTLRTTDVVDVMLSPVRSNLLSSIISQDSDDPRRLKSKSTLRLNEALNIISIKVLKVSAMTMYLGRQLKTD